MRGNNFQSIGGILDDMKNNPEKLHEHNINRLIQKFGKEYKSEIIGRYNMERKILEENNSIPSDFIFTRLCYNVEQTFNLANPIYESPDNSLSNKYIDDYIK